MAFMIVGVCASIPETPGRAQLAFDGWLLFVPGRVGLSCSKTATLLRVERVLHCLQPAHALRVVW